MATKAAAKKTAAKAAAKKTAKRSAATKKNDDPQRAAFIAAIAQQEGNSYTVVNHASGALGKYQVMPANLRSWTTRALGHPLNSAQFLANPAAQEAVASTVLGGYYDQYGAKGAAAAWYAGPANHTRFNDASPQPNGPSIASYVQSVLAHMGTIEKKGGIPNTAATSTTDLSHALDGAQEGGSFIANGDKAEPDDWIGALDALLNPQIGGPSLNPFKDITNLSDAVQLVAARAGFAFIGLILLGTGLAVAFGPSILSGLAPAAAVEDPAVAAAAEIAKNSERETRAYHQERARGAGKKRAREDAKKEDA